MSLTVLFPNEGDSLKTLLRRVKETKGDVLLMLLGLDEKLAQDEEELKGFLEACLFHRDRLRLVTKQKPVASAARLRGIRVVTKTSELRHLLEGHLQATEALRFFSPNLWRQQLRTRLQSMGLLVLPRLRVVVLSITSIGLFFFVVLKLLPSAEIRIVSRQDTISHTVNIFLVQSGATVSIPSRVRMMTLQPMTVEISKTITFDQISKEFTGQNSRVTMTVINKAQERYALKKGSRLSNQAGMIFRIQDAAIVEPGEEMTVPAVAEDTDLYGELIGERGNVPAGLRWEFLGLAPEERLLVYGENRAAARGGTTSHRTVLREADLQTAQKKLEQELLAQAKQIVDEKKEVHNAVNREDTIEVLYYDELTKVEYKDFSLPTQFLGQQVASIPVSGAIRYTAYAYDNQDILRRLHEELRSHAAEGKRLLDDSVSLSRLVVHVIDYTDDLSWIKLTVDLSGKEEYVLDPLTPTGAHFARTVRERVAGARYEESLRIIRNLPEVDDVKISIWPFWSKTLPTIPSNIYIVPLSAH